MINPIQAGAADCRTYPPRLLELPSSAEPGAPTKWVALIPCSHVVAPPTVVDEAGTGTGGVLGILTDPIPQEFLPDQVWLDHYDHGFLQLFDISDPWSISQDSSKTITNGGVVETVRKPHRSTLDPLMLPEAGTSVFRVETAQFTVGGQVKTLAFAVNFNGSVEVFDITDILYVNSPLGYREPISSTPGLEAHGWVAPLSVFDAIPNNIRAIAVDRIADNKAMVYVGVSRMGIMSVPYDPVQGFDDNERHLVKTPGEVWGLELRDTVAVAGVSSPQARSLRTLLCADSYGGNRVYSVGYINDQSPSGTAAPAPAGPGQ